MNGNIEKNVDFEEHEEYTKNTLIYPLMSSKRVKSERSGYMYDIGQYKEIFDQYGGMMRARQLDKEKIFYRKLQRLIADGYVEKIRPGYYQWIDSEDFSEAGTITRLYPDAIFCMDSALRYYGYSERTPGEWHVAVSKDAGKSRFNLDYPFVKPYYIEPSILKMGLTEGTIDGHVVHIYDKDRVICDCLRYRNKMDKETFNKAIQSYVRDPAKNIPRLLAYSRALRVNKVARDLIGVWL